MRINTCKYRRVHQDCCWIYWDVITYGFAVEVTSSLFCLTPCGSTIIVLLSWPIAHCSPLLASESYPSTTPTCLWSPWSSNEIWSPRKRQVLELWVLTNDISNACQCVTTEVTRHKICLADDIPVRKPYQIVPPVKLDEFRVILQSF